MNYAAIDNFVIPDFDFEYAEHSGVKRKSGRFEYGEGEIPFQHEPWFTWGKNAWYNKYQEYKSQGKSDTQIAEEMGLGVKELKTKVRNAKNDERIQIILTNEALISRGIESRSERARILGVNESTLRSLEDAQSRERTERARKTADILKQQIDTVGPIDVSAGAEHILGVSRGKFDQALQLLQEEGYEKFTGRVEQVTNEGKFTTTTVLCPPGTGHYNDDGDYVSDVVYHPERVHLIDVPGGVHEIAVTSDDGGNSFRQRFQYPASMDSKRVYIRYGDEGGEERDGTIEIRPGVADLSLGESHYAQVRILVDGDHYMKGMAHYMTAQTAIDIPEAYDVIYNTRKKSGTPPEKIFKEIGKDPDNPFGSLIKENGGQSTYIDPKTGERKLSLINKRSDEGDWEEWSDKLASQFLSKQRKELVEKQLNLSIAEKRDELEAIRQLDNPTLRKHYLIDFAQSADKDSVTLKAAALPGQKYKVIMPEPTLKENEVYAPEYENGTKLALIRFPHGGTFEIPILTVNNKNKEAKEKLGTTPLDAVAINGKVAQQLSGADFDGDTVLIIPNADKQHILARPLLKQLEGFDPEESYGYGDIDDSKKKIMSEHYKQIQMGVVSNLISDMTIKGAPDDEVARAVKHSMVVIDAIKHKLDYSRSERENGIDNLKRKYQGHYDLDGNWKETGASTIISRAKNEEDIPQTQGEGKIDPETGKVIYKPKMKTVKDPETGEKVQVPDEGYINKKGKFVEYTKKSNQMSVVDDAFLLISDYNSPIEVAYAKYANELKSMANEARKESLTTGSLIYDKNAAKTYSEQVDSLKEKIIIAESNAPYERAAQRKAKMVSDEKKAIDNSLTDKEIGKINQQALTAARLEYGAQRFPIDISDKEWEAIQNGAISDHMFTRILKYADTDKLRQRAMPISIDVLPEAKQNRIRAMENSGYTIAEIADRLDVSPSTVKKYLKINQTEGE